MVNPDRRGDQCYSVRRALFHQVCSLSMSPYAPVSIATALSGFLPRSLAPGALPLRLFVQLSLPPLYPLHRILPLSIAPSSIRSMMLCFADPLLFRRRTRRRGPFAPKFGEEELYDDDEDDLPGPPPSDEPAAGTEPVELTVVPTAAAESAHTAEATEPEVDPPPDENAAELSDDKT